MTTLTYTLLALSICAVWLPPLRITKQLKLPLWLATGLLAAACGLIAGVLFPPGLISLTAFGLFAWLASRDSSPRWQRLTFVLLTIIAVLALALHRLPGFNNPVLLTGIKFSADSAPFTLYANFDKGAVGLVLLALFCRRTTSLTEFAAVLRQAVPTIAATIIAVLGLALAVHFVRVDIKIPESTLVFFAVNLFFAVAPEEAFFRGLIQDRLSLALGSSRWGSVTTIAISALLFGTVHLAGGIQYAGLGTLAGVGYAIAYQRTCRIESAVAAHFLLNAAQFVTLSYPYLQ